MKEAELHGSEVIVRYSNVSSKAEPLASMKAEVQSAVEVVKRKDCG